MLTFTKVGLEDTRIGETAAAPTYPISAAKASLAVSSAVHREAAKATQHYIPDHWLWSAL